MKENFPVTRLACCIAIAVIAVRTSYLYAAEDAYGNTVASGSITSSSEVAGNYTLGTISPYSLTEESSGNYFFMTLSGR